MCKGINACVPINMTIVYNERDVDARRKYRSNQSIGGEPPLAKKVRLGSNREICSDVIAVSCTGEPEFDPKEPKYISSKDFNSLTHLMLAPCPLLRPSDILHVSEEVKAAVLRSASLVGKPAPPIACGGESPNDGVPLYHSDKHPFVYAELYHRFAIRRANIFRTGNGTAIKGCIIEGVTCCAMFVNDAHRDAVLAELRRWLFQRVSDPTDARFYRAPPKRALEERRSVPKTPKQTEMKTPERATSARCSTRSPAASSRATFDGLLSES